MTASGGPRLGRVPSAEEALDELVAAVVAGSPFRFAVATTAEEREVAFRLRHDAVVAGGWAPPAPPSGDDAGAERDEYDDAAVHVVGWDGAEPVCTGRLVVPPSPLPTEEACGFRVEPAGQVVDVGRMVVAPPYQHRSHRTFVFLTARLYGEVRGLGYRVACGMMTAQMRGLMRHLGFRLDLLGPDRTYWGERRAPVRFELAANAPSLLARWGPED